MTDHQDQRDDETSVEDQLAIAQDDLDEAVKMATTQGYLTMEQRLLFAVAGSQVAIGRALAEIGQQVELLLPPSTRTSRAAAGKATTIKRSDFEHGSILDAQVEDGMEVLQPTETPVCPLCGGTPEGGELSCQHSMHAARRGPIHFSRHPDSRGIVHQGFIGECEWCIPYDAFGVYRGGPA